MWDSVIIGTGSRGNSAVKVFSIDGDHSISENKASYWVSDVYLGLGMTVFKDTKEGGALSEMIKSQESVVEINNFLFEVMIKNITSDKLKMAIDSEINKAFDAGKREKAKEIRKALGL